MPQLAQFTLALERPILAHGLDSVGQDGQDGGMKIGQRLISTCLVVAALSAAASSGAGYLFDEGEKARCAMEKAQIEAKIPGRNFSKGELVSEWVRRENAIPEGLDPALHKYALAVKFDGLDNPLWCQTSRAQNLRPYFDAPAFVLAGLVGLALFVGICLGALYAVVRVIKLAWR